MKNVKLSIVTAVMAMAGFAAEVGAADLMVSSGSPSVYFNDTDFSKAANEYAWRSNTEADRSGSMYLYDFVFADTPIVIEHPIVTGTNSNYALWSKSDGDVCLAKNALCIDRSANKHNSLHVNSSGDITLANSKVFIERSTGRVGIGTLAPTEKVDVATYTKAARFQLTSVTDIENQAAQFIQRRARAGGGGIDGLALKNGDNIGLFSFRGWNGAGWTGSKAVIAVAATEDWDGSSNGNQISFRHTPNNSTTMVTALQIKGHGDVYIPNGHLYVRGMNIPDYVFEKNYELMPLDELKAYVDKNNHLPGVASAKEVNQEGIVNLSELQMTLLEKVEELTLYTLQQEEALVAKDLEMKAIQAEIIELKSMKQKVAKLESILSNLALDSSASKQEKVSIK